MRIDPGPRDIGKLIDDAILLYRQNLRTILLTALLIVFPMALLWGLASSSYYSFLFSPEFIDPAAAGDVSTTFLVWTLVLQALIYIAVPLRFAANSFMSSALFKASPELMAGGHPGTKTFMRGGLTRWLNLIAVLVVVTVLVYTLAFLVYLVTIPMLIPFFLAGSVAPWLILVGIVLWLLVVGLGYVYIQVRFSVAGPAVVSEDGNIFTAIRRTWQLTRGRVWRTSLFYLGVWRLASALKGALYAPAAFLLADVFNSALQSPEAFVPDVPIWITVALGVFAALAESIVIPFDRLCWSQLYVDLRARGEGMDLVVRARELAGSET